MEIATAPVFHSLNKPQKRALMMRDSLRFMEPCHLDSYIDGIVDGEPPSYRHINGVIQPPLVKVTLKDTAARFDLGNVHFTSEPDLAKNGIRRAFLTVEDGRIELRTEDALPAEEANLESVPIHAFIAKTMVAMFETKFKAIYARMKKINEIRQLAFNMTDQQAPQFEEGETLARLDPENRTANGTSNQLKRITRRKPGEPVPKHSTNKRKRVGLDTIPDAAKSSTFNTIPDCIKVDLFNNVVKTAFPNFDNLMMASWNVVSVYSNVGSEFPEMHKAVVELKGVLQDFEEGFGAKKENGPEMRMRAEWMSPALANGNMAIGTGNGHGTNGTNGSNGTGFSSPIPDATQDGASDALVSSRSGSVQRRDRLGSLFHEPEPETEREPAQEKSPPPRLVELGNDDDEDDVVAPDRRRERHLSSSPLFMPEHSPDPRRIKSSREQRSATRPFENSTRDTTESPELLRRREEYASSRAHIAKFKNSTGAVQTPHTSAVENEERIVDAESLEVRDRSTRSPTASASRKAKSLDNMSTAELRQLYRDRKEKLIKDFGRNENVPQQYRKQMQTLLDEIKTREAREEEDDVDDNSEQEQPASQPRFLGHSVLGSKKQMGIAPVAPMLHTRKESGGGSLNGGGTRRGY